MTTMIDDSGLIANGGYELSHSRRNGSWTLRDRGDKVRAWREPTLMRIVADATGLAPSYRYDVAGNDSSRFQPSSRSLEGVLLAVASHPMQFSIPPRLRGDYSAQELAIIEAWQHELLAGPRDGSRPPIDPQALAIGDALRLMADDGDAGARATGGEG